MRLVILTGSLAVQTFDIPPDGLTCGRRDDCRLRLSASDAVVSNLHATPCVPDSISFHGAARQPK